MPNQRIDGHALVGTRHLFRAAQSPYDPAADTEPGVLVVAPGHHVEVLAVFANWNGIDGLDMFYVRCEETGLSTHVTPADLGMPRRL